MVGFLSKHRKGIAAAGIAMALTGVSIVQSTCLATTTSYADEATTSPELSHSQAIHKMLLQTNSCYAQVTDSIKGDANVLKKLDATVTVINGKNMVPVDYAKEMGYSVTLNTAKKTVTLDNGERKIVLTLGSKTMKITKDGKTTSVNMDSSMQLDKNRDYAISISAFGKAVDAPVQWDSVTKTIGINYTKTEFLEVKKTDAAITELNFKALTNIAGGEFIASQTFTNPVEKLSIGATVVYSSAKDKAAEKKLLTKYQSRLKKDDIVYCMGGKAYVTRTEKTVNEDGSFNYTDSVYKLDGGAVGESSKINYVNGVLKYEVNFDYSSKCLVATDGIKVMADYSAKTGKWTERNEYKMLGSPEQLIRKKLDKCLNGYEVGANGKKNINVLGLDPKEAARYCETGDDSKCKTFKIMENAKGEPAFIVNTSSKYGFNEAGFNYIQQAVDRFNEIDPKIIDIMTNRYGLTCVTYDIGGRLEGQFKKCGDWMGTYDSYLFGNIIFINQNKDDIVNSTNSYYPRVSIASTILAESRACYYREMNSYGRNIAEAKEGFYQKPGIDCEEADKFVYMIDKFNEWLNEKVLTRKEYNQWLVDAESFLNGYDPSYTPTWKWIDDDSDFVPEKN